MFKNPFTSFFFFSVLLMCMAQSGTAQGLRFRFTQPKMGSPFHLVLYAGDSAAAKQKANEAFALIDSLNKIFSDYDSTSELMQLSATGGKDSFVPVSTLLYDVLVQSKRAAEKSGGTFDITIGPLSRLWRQARRQKDFPSARAVQAAKAKTGMHHIIIDTATKKVKLLQAGMQLDLGGIGKGYIAQAVVDYLKGAGITQVLADAGGDIACGDAPPGKKGWTVAINIPGEKNKLLPKPLLLANSAVATSGDVYQYTEHKGKRYGHIIDPRTGYGVTFQRNVTVIAPNGATADWLATACSILPVGKAKKLARKKGAALLITQMKKEKLRSRSTQTFDQFWEKE